MPNVNPDLKRSFMWGIGLAIGLTIAVYLTGLVKKL